MLDFFDFSHNALLSCVPLIMSFLIFHPTLPFFPSSLYFTFIFLSFLSLSVFTSHYVSLFTTGWRGDNRHLSYLCNVVNQYIIPFHSTQSSRVVRSQRARGIQMPMKSTKETNRTVFRRPEQSKSTTRNFTSVDAIRAGLRTQNSDILVQSTSLDRSPLSYLNS